MELGGDVMSHRNRTIHTATNWRGQGRTPFAPPRDRAPSDLRGVPLWVMLLQAALLLGALAWGAMVTPGAGR